MIRMVRYLVTRYNIIIFTWNATVAYYFEPLLAVAYLSCNFEVFVFFYDTFTENRLLCQICPAVHFFRLPSETGGSMQVVINKKILSSKLHHLWGNHSFCKFKISFAHALRFPNSVLDAITASSCAMGWHCVLPTQEPVASCGQHQTQPFNVFEPFLDPCIISIFRPIISKMGNLQEKNNIPNHSHVSHVQEWLGNTTSTSACRCGHLHAIRHVRLPSLWQEGKPRALNFKKISQTIDPCLNRPPMASLRWHFHFPWPKDESGFCPLCWCRTGWNLMAIPAVEWQWGNMCMVCKNVSYSIVQQISIGSNER